AALSTYGGSKADRRAASGFFRTARSGARWWLVDPEGYPFIHVGVVNTTFPKGSGSASDWAATTTDLLHAHGFNGTGAWSDTELLRAAPHPVVYTRMWNFMGAYGAKRGGTYQQSGHLGYPQDCIFVFDPAFVAFCDDYAQRLASTKDDPWLLGHFSDNELPFYTKSLDNFLKLPPSDPGRVAVDEWRAARRTAHPAEAAAAPFTDEMRQAFLGFV
ncbi:MAG: hypothetical protein CFE26_22365, partial [Verrucomicrobiales bacterium VVV1]